MNLMMNRYFTYLCGPKVTDDSTTDNTTDSNRSESIKDIDFTNLNHLNFELCVSTTLWFNVRMDMNPFRPDVFITFIKHMMNMI